MHVQNALPWGDVRSAFLKYSDGVQLGRIHRISIFVDPSWMVVFALVTYLVSICFAELHPDWAFRQCCVLAALMTLLFFVCVVLHELAHSAVAVHYGIPVISIRLFLFGGLAQISREPSKPVEELQIAIAGPLASTFLGLVLHFSSLVFPGIQRAGALLAYLAGANFSLALFNLLPGLPLDGGRILRAIVWGLTGDVKRASEAAIFSGNLIGFLMILFGLGCLSVGQGGGWVGLGMALLGSFLLTSPHSRAADAEERQQ